MNSIFISNEEAKSTKAENYELAPALRAALIKTIGDPLVLKKLIEKESLWKGDLEIYKVTNKLFCQELRKLILENKEVNERYKESIKKKLDKLGDLMINIEKESEKIVGVIKDFKVSFGVNVE